MQGKTYTACIVALLMLFVFLTVSYTSRAHSNKAFHFIISLD